MPGKRKIKKMREDAANKCKNKSLMGPLGKYTLFPYPPPLPSWWACPEAEVLDTSIRTGATYRGGAMPTPPWNLVGKVLNIEGNSSLHWF